MAVHVYIACPNLRLTCLMDVALSVSVQSHYSLLAIVYSYRDVQSLHYSYISDCHILMHVLN